MAIRLFEALGGITDGNVSYLSGAGVPGGDGSYQDAALVGSYYTDTTSGATYKKVTAGAGTSNWIRVATTADLSGLSQQQSWREPVAVLDATSTSVTAALSTMNASDAIDGHALAAGDRILFTAFTAPDNPNVYIVGGSSGAWSLTEDQNTATAGDTLRVLEGTYAGQEWLFDGTTWLWIGQQTTAEESAIRAFIGKGAAGGELPAYTSSNYVANSDSLETAIGKLDAALLNVSNTASGNAAAITSNTNLINTVIAAAGLSSGGTYTANAAAAYIDTATSLANADDLLDAALAAEAGRLANVVTATGLNADGTLPALASTTYLTSATSVVNALTLLDAQVATNANAVSALQGQVGSATWLGTNYVDGATNLTDAINLLDTAIGNAVGSASTSTSGTAITLDAVSVDSASVIKWVVVVEDAANSANRVAFEVLAVHDGTSVADATKIDHTRYGKVDVGNKINNLHTDVTLAGTGVNQTAQLSVTAGIPVVASARRITV